MFSLVFLMMLGSEIDTVSHADEIRLEFVDDENWFDQSLPMNLKIISEGKTKQTFTSIKLILGDTSVILYKDISGVSRSVECLQENIFIEADRKSVV